MKPRIVVSKCLEFDAFRYDGEKITDKAIKQLSRHIEFIPTCPDIVRFEQDYLRKQTYFQSFPEPLFLPLDSSKTKRTYRNV